MALVTPEIASIRPYIPGKPIEELERELGIVDAVKLASNENPLGPSPKAVEAIKRELSQLSYYPEGDAPNLKKALSAQLGVDRSELVVGNGSNEVLELIVRTFATTAHHAVYSVHAFLVYPLVLTAAGVPFTTVPMKDMTHDLVAMKAAINDKTRIVFIANPNNPTGTYNTIEELERFLTGLPEDLIVALDEAYFEYADAPDYPDGLKYRSLHKNLVVLRTFSKCHGLAGLRVGYGVARPEVVNFLNRVRQPFNSNRVAQVGAEAALGDTEYIAYSVSENRRERAWLSAQIAERGLEYLPSQTNFILIKLPHPGQKVTQAMLHEGVIIRAMDGYGLPDHVRVTVGTSKDNHRFLAALDKVLEEL